VDLQRRAHSCILKSINRKKERKSSNRMNLVWTLQGQIYVTKSQWTSTDIC
jgi:hypothetical protein